MTGDEVNTTQRVVRERDELAKEVERLSELVRRLERELDQKEKG